MFLNVFILRSWVLFLKLPDFNVVSARARLVKIWFLVTESFNWIRKRISERIEDFMHVYPFTGVLCQREMNVRRNQEKLESCSSPF